MKNILILSLLVVAPMHVSASKPTHANKYGTCVGLAASALEYSSGLGDYITWKMRLSSVEGKADAAGLTKYDIDSAQRVAFNSVEQNDEHFRFSVASTRFKNANCND